MHTNTHTYTHTHIILSHPDNPFVLLFDAFTVRLPIAIVQARGKSYLVSAVAFKMLPNSGTRTSKTQEAQAAKNNPYSNPEVPWAKITCWKSTPFSCFSKRKGTLFQ